MTPFQHIRLASTVKVSRCFAIGPTSFSKGALILVNARIPLKIMHMRYALNTCPQSWPQIMWVTPERWGRQRGVGGMMSLPSKLMRIEISDVSSA
jgi:hypothetical protein